MESPTNPAGFREQEHTADWELNVWAPDLAGLLEHAARGMYYLSGVLLQSGPRIQRTIHLEWADPEGLLVAFLTELLYLGEEQGLGFDTYALQIEDRRLTAVLEGAHITRQDKEVKAVTFHNLNIRPGEEGLQANIVFDV